jgi:hypothetical protein
MTAANPSCIPGGGYSGFLADPKWHADWDPLADIRSLEKLENIALVMKGGRIVTDRRASLVTV